MIPDQKQTDTAVRAEITPEVRDAARAYMAAAWEEKQAHQRAFAAYDKLYFACLGASMDVHLDKVVQRVRAEMEIMA